MFKKNINKKWIWAGVGLFIFSILLVGGSGENNTPKTSVDKQNTEELASEQSSNNKQVNEGQQVETTSPPPPASGELSVYFFDVGQADATLLKGPDFTILVDAGDYRRNDVVPYLQSVGVNNIDLLIGTHPHADHIGQFPQVIDAFNIGEVWMSGEEHTSKTFEGALDAVLASDAKYHEPRAGEAYNFGSLRVEVINPPQLTGDLHRSSVSIRAIYGDTAFVFTGDAESETESLMVQSGHSLNAQILQLGHHGSKTSSSIGFLKAVNPEVAIYSAAQNSQYGHPHQETINAVLGEGINLYGTAENGTIVVNTNGVSYSIETGRTGDTRAPPSEPTPAPQPEPEPTPPPPPPPASGNCDAGQVDINTASFEELQQIIHIGPVRAEDLISLRPFSSVDSMTRISGIGPSRLNDIKSQNIACVN